MAASALALAALNIPGTVVAPGRQEAEDLDAMWRIHRGLPSHPQSLLARGAKAARALVAATGWMQVSCWRASFEAYDPLAEPAPPPRGVAASSDAVWHQAETS